jgi:hypothetical protein
MPSLEQIAETGIFSIGSDFVRMEFAIFNENFTALY